MNGGNRKENPLKWRYLAFVLILLAMFAYLLSGLVNLQLKSSEEYAEQAESDRTKTIVLRGKRGQHCGCGIRDAGGGRADL